MNIITEYLAEKNINKNNFSKISGIPYSTLCDICSDKTPLKNCTAETIYKLSKATKLSAEEILSSACEQPVTFDWFKSEVCHEVKRKGEIKFIKELLKSNRIRSYYKQMKYEYSLYLLAMLDYLSRKNNIPICSDYNDLRTKKFKNPIFPQSILIEAKLAHDDSIKTNAIKNSIPEFIKFNIVENEVEDIA